MKIITTRYFYIFYFLLYLFFGFLGLIALYSLGNGIYWNIYYEIYGDLGMWEFIVNLRDYMDNGPWELCLYIIFRIGEVSQFY
jgi:hypothetical protein